VAAADFLLEHMSRTLFDPIDTTQVGSLDPKLHARVNGEIYRFASSATMEKFRKNPVRWCGIVRDPVNGVTFVPDRFSPREDTKESPYFFASDSTRDVFQRDPAHYEIHRNY